MPSTQFSNQYRKTLTSRGMLISSGLFTLVAVAFLASSLKGSEESQAQKPGLRGILPEDIPQGLDAEAFSVLDGNWESWSKEVSEKVASLYMDETLDAAGQQRLIESLKSKLGVMERALADRRYQSIFEPLIDLHGKMTRQVHVAEAALDTLQLDATKVREARKKQALRNLASAVEDLERDMDNFRGGDAWLKFVRTRELKALKASDDPVLPEVKQKLQGRESLSSDKQREFLGRQSFLDLEKAVTALIDADSFEPKQIDAQKLRESLAALLAALSEYEATGGIEAAARMHASLQETGRHSLDGGDRIDEALRTHYLNHNLRVAASEQFLDRALREKRTEKGPVVDFILGANVRGNQTTTTTIGIDLKQQEDGARFAIKADGIVHSSTSGTTDKATIYTDGYHRFAARKEVIFDGKKFTTRPATISVDANNRTVGASTDLSGAPLLGGLARNVAMRQARKKRPQSEAIARGRVSDRVLPKFNREVDEEFEDADKELESRVAERLRDAGLYPERRRFTTTESGFYLYTRTTTAKELGGDVPSFSMDPGEGVLLALHESLINNALDRLALAGRSLTEEELIVEIEKSISKLLGRDVKLSSDESDADEEKSTDKFVFDPNDPIRVQIENGSLDLILRTGIQQEDKNDIPTQIVTVPLSLRIDGNQLLIERGATRVEPLERPSNPAVQIARSGVMRKKIEAAIQDRRRDRKISITREGKEDLIVTLTAIQARDGWLRIRAE